MTTSSNPFPPMPDAEPARRQPPGAETSAGAATREETDAEKMEHCYRQLVQALPVPIYTCDSQGRIMLFNEAAVALWGRTPAIGEELWSGSWKMFDTDGRPIPRDQCPMAVMLRTGVPACSREMVIERPDGKRFNVLPHPQPLRGDAGTLIGAVNMLVDVTERRQSDARIEAQLRELRRWHEVTIEREDRVRELKREVNGLLIRQGQRPRYDSEAAPAK